MAKVKNDYFKMLEDQTMFCVDAVELLENILNNYSPSSSQQKREEMHKIEKAADNFHHEILAKLYSEFITPIDQEDILRLVQIIDDITDAIDEVVIECYMYHINVIPQRAIELVELAKGCVKGLYGATAELKNFKKPQALREFVFEFNAIETKADGVYVEAIRELYDSGADYKTLTACKTLYESLESICDLCEYAGDAIEHIIIKNT